MTVITSRLLVRTGFIHGFGTRHAVEGDIPSDVHVLRQVHGERIVCLAEGVTRGQSAKGKVQGEDPNLVFRGLPEEPFRFDRGDALVTAIPGIALGIRTADCLPVLAGDPSTGMAAAVHCGWRSLALDLPGKVIRLMVEEWGASGEDLVAALGPSISTCCYEVGPEVIDLFRGYDTGGKPYDIRDDRYYLDLRSITRCQLLMAGMDPDNIDDLRECVACRPERFHSHRGKRSEERMLSYIRSMEKR